MNKELFEKAVMELSKNTGKSLKESRDILESAVDILKMEKYRGKRYGDYSFRE